jgi:hypothetical protein
VHFPAKNRRRASFDEGAYNRKTVMKALITALALVVAFALPAEAQLTLQISNGRVTLDATNVPARQILSEWARIGGTKVVGADKIIGAPLTLKLVDMPEKQALDIILRNVAGFMAAPRLASATPGASAYDRILIMATTSAPAPSANARGGVPSANFGNPVNGTQRRVPPRPPNLPPSLGDDPPQDDQQPTVEDDQVDADAAQQPVFTFPGQPGQPGQMGPAGQPGTNNPVFVPMPGNTINGASPGTTVAPVITLQPGTNGPTIYNFVPNDGTTPPPPPTTTPNFGVVGSPTPGMIQVPQQPTPGQPPPTRPPGGE